MKTTKKVGFKELVKNGEMSAGNAFNTLAQQASKAGGKIGLQVFRTSKSGKWLSRRIHFNTKF